ncbi:MAG: hypothetical protein ABI579_00210 [Candidatus Sumerlaeota bacterium]
MKTEPNYFRASLGMKQEIAPAIAADYHSGIVDWMRASGNTLALEGITFRLAKEFGFCYGVDKAVDMAYETCMKFPDRRIFLTYEIIHNPRVNNRLKEMGIEFLSGALKGSLTFDDIGADDVVIMPAFGVQAEYLEQLRAKGSVLVDTTCGSVVHVWKRVEKYAKDGYTSLVHGKALHAETLATISQAHKMGGHTIVVLDKAQAQLVCDIITGDAPPESIQQLGPISLTKNFDPRQHLEKIGEPDHDACGRIAGDCRNDRRRDGEALREGKPGRALPQLRYNLFRDAGTSGCNCGPRERRRDRHDAGDRRLQFIEHGPPAGHRGAGAARVAHQRFIRNPFRGGIAPSTGPRKGTRNRARLAAHWAGQHRFDCGGEHAEQGNW